MTVTIIANGSFPRSEYPKYLIRSADLRVCCDGALKSLQLHGFVPDIVIGDLDSVCTRALKRFNGTVVKDPDQETNDLTKAFNYVIDNCPDADTIHIVGATGKSEAHTVGNMSLLTEYEKIVRLKKKSIKLDMVSDYSTIFAVSESGDLHVGAGRRISLFSPDPTQRIRSRGLKWSTDNVVFDNWWKATLNIASEDIVSLELDHLSPVLVVLD